ncbi:MAG: hypothetical protein FWE45_02990 [Firmicutes bacterium]|nr:hypothetical protein [Bacillota bacterium]
MKKKAIFGGIVIGTCCVLLLSGCNANSADAAARMSDKTANRADTIIKKIDTYEDTHYRFPSAFGNEFFVTDHDYKDDFRFKSETSYEIKDNTSSYQKDAAKSRGIKMFRPTSKKINKKTPATVNANTNEINQRYQARHFEHTKLNQNNQKKQAYMNRLDDLYMLCADISAANTKQNQLISQIREESNMLRQNASGLYGKKTKADWSEFNKAHDDTNKAMTKLYRDRNSVGKRIRMLPKKSDNVHPEKLTTRYQYVMSKLDCRIDKLEQTKSGLERMNNSITKMNPQSNIEHNINPSFDYVDFPADYGYQSCFPCQEVQKFTKPEPYMPEVKETKNPNEKLRPARYTNPFQRNYIEQGQELQINMEPSTQHSLSTPSQFNEQEPTSMVSAKPEFKKETRPARFTPTTTPNLDDVPKKTLDVKTEEPKQVKPMRFMQEQKEVNKPVYLKPQIEKVEEVGCAEERQPVRSPFFQSKDGSKTERPMFFNLSKENQQEKNTFRADPNFVPEKPVEEKVS